MFFVLSNITNIVILVRSEMGTDNLKDFYIILRKIEEEQISDDQFFDCISGGMEESDRFFAAIST